MMQALKRSIFISSLLLVYTLNVYATSEPQAAQQAPTSLEEHRQAIKAKREAIKNDRRKAEILKDEESMILLDYLEKFLAAQSICFDKPEEVSADICVLSTLKKMAEEDNFIAQHELANLYVSSYGNIKLAQQWYQKALDNPKTPRAYKIVILKDMDQLKSKTETPTPPPSEGNKEKGG